MKSVGSLRRRLFRDWLGLSLAYGGLLAAFTVQAAPDLLVKTTLATGQGVPRIGNASAVAVVVTNLGPASANGVVVSNYLSPTLQFVSATNTRGTCTNMGG